MMMPLLKEVPSGRTGVAIMQSAVHVTLFGARASHQRSAYACAAALCAVC